MRIAPKAACAAAFYFLSTVAVFAAEQPPGAPDARAAAERVEAFKASLHPQHGDIAIAAATATLHLGDRYYFLPAADAKKVLTEAWGNPADLVQDVLGMVFPEGTDFTTDDGWAAVVSFRDTGYISDSDAKSMDYDALLRDMRAPEDEENQERKSAGLPSVHLVGWATPPTYDAANHVLVWAREIAFGEDTVHTLNYDLRALGRRGVLSMNIIASMEQIDRIRNAAAALEPIAAFDNGARYADYVPGTDKSAGYGLAGLVMAGVGVAAAQKLGLLAVALLFLKKAGVLIVAGGAAAVGAARRFFRRQTPS